MSKARQALVLGMVAIAALAAGLLLYPHDQTGPGAMPPASAAGLMQASLPDLSGQNQPLEQWKGKVLVVNFWATWCPPCRKEIPALIEVQNRLGARGLQIVGIAIDRPAQVKPYAQEMHINYPILIGELDAMDLVRQAGNAPGGLPYTVVLDRSGRPVRSELGGVTVQKLEEIVTPLL